MGFRTHNSSRNYNVKKKKEKLNIKLSGQFSLERERNHQEKIYLHILRDFIEIGMRIVLTFSTQEEILYSKM